MQVDFYVLETAAERGRLSFACRLVEKAWLRGHRIFVHTDSSTLCQDFDDLLWTFKQDSFVPHARQAPGRPSPAPLESVEAVVVGEVVPDGVDVLVNLANEVPQVAGELARANRIAEIVGGAEAARAAGRARYRYYRDRGDEIRQHRL